MKTEKLKLKKIIIIIAILVIVAGIVTISTVGFNVGIDYVKCKNIEIHFDDSYNMSDINNIVNDVFGNETKKVQEIEYFNNAVLINVMTASDEQIDILKQKISEVYSIEDIDEHINVTDMPEYHLKDLIKPYITPIAITTVIIFAYLGIRFKRLGVKRTIIIPLALLFLLEMVYISIVAICRIPFGRFIIPISLLIYVAMMVGIVTKLSKIEEAIKLESNKKK